MLSPDPIPYMQDDPGPVAPMPEGFRSRPHDVQTEQVLLGTILMDNDAFHEVEGFLKAEHFHEPVHRRIYATVADMIGRDLQVSAVIIGRPFADDPDLKELGGRKYLADLVRQAGFVDTAEDYGRHIRDLWLKRGIIEACERIANRAYDGTAIEPAAEQISALVSEAGRLGEQGEPLDGAYAAMDIAAAMEAPRPIKRWIVDQWVPEGFLTLFAGDGGTGKSLLAQQLANCVATGRPFLGSACMPCRVLMVATEDDADELTIRQQDIAADMGLGASDLAGRLDLMPRVGMANILVQFQGDVGETTPAYAMLERYIAETRPGLAILDNIAELMAGDMNLTSHVKFFCNRLSALTRKHGTSIILIGHVPKNNGASGYFGSVAWKGSVRSLMVLKSDDEDKDLRILSRLKANYASKDEEGVKLTWSRGVLRPDAQELLSYGERLEREMRLGEIEQIFLDALDHLTGKRFSVSHARTPSKNYAPDVIMERGLNGGCTLREIEAAMKRLEVADKIRRQQELPWTRAGNRHPAVGIARTAQ